MTYIIGIILMKCKLYNLITILKLIAKKKKVRITILPCHKLLENASVEFRICNKFLQSLGSTTNLYRKSFDY